jgi:beta-galactosidase
MKWVAYPEGIYKVLKEAWEKYHLPIYIMENGLADSADKYRAEFIKDHVSEMKKAMTEGVEVKGYCYWSLLDNFEWLHGFAPRFGLLAVDYKNQKRTPRSSFGAYRDIIKQNNEL